MELKRETRKAFDDSQIAHRQGERYHEVEQKQKSMTLGRPRKQKVKLQATDDGPPPPPLPTRMQSKKRPAPTKVEGTSQEDYPKPPPRTQSKRPPVALKSKESNNVLLPSRVKSSSGKYRDGASINSANSSDSLKPLSSQNEESIQKPLQAKGVASKIASRQALLQASIGNAPTHQQKSKAELTSNGNSVKPKNEEGVQPRPMQSTKQVSSQIASLQASLTPTDKLELNKDEYTRRERDTKQEQEQAAQQSLQRKGSTKGVSSRIAAQRALFQASLDTKAEINKSREESTQEQQTIQETLPKSKSEYTSKARQNEHDVQQPLLRKESLKGVPRQITSRRAIPKASLPTADQQDNSPTEPEEQTAPAPKLPQRKQSMKSISPQIASRQAIIHEPFTSSEKGEMELTVNRGTQRKMPILRKPIMSIPKEKEALASKLETTLSLNGSTGIQQRQEVAAESSSFKSIPPVLNRQPLPAPCQDETNFNQTRKPLTFGTPTADWVAKPSGNLVTPIKETTSMESLDQDLDEDFDSETYESIDDIIPPPTVPEPERKQQPITFRRTSNEMCNTVHDEDRQLKEPPYQDEVVGVSGEPEEQSGNLRELAGPIDLLTMISKYTHFLPVCVRVCHGYCSSITESFSQFDQLRLHFVKHCKVGVLIDEESSETYTIPVSSTLRFGLVYESDGFDVTQPLRTVRDITEMDPLPVAILATKQFKGGTPEKSVEANELLFVKQVSKSLLWGKGRVLEVVTTDHKIKHLSSKCAGDFSVHPMDIQLSLTTIIEHSIQLPQKIVLFPDYTIRSFLPESMKDQPVVLESIRGETSVICTIKDTECETEEQKVMDMSTDLNIKFEIDPITESDEKELYDTTTLLYHTLNPSQLEFITEKSTRSSYDFQCLLYKNLVTGREMDGVHFQLPNACSLGVQPQVDQFQPPGQQIDPTPDTQSMLSTEDSFSTSDIQSLHQQHSGSTDLSNNEDEGLYEDVNTACNSLPPKEESRLKNIMKTNTTKALFQKLTSAVSRITKTDNKTKDSKEQKSDCIPQLPTELENDNIDEIDTDYMPHVPEGTPPPALPPPYQADTVNAQGIEPEECYEPILISGMENEEGGVSLTKLRTNSSSDTDHSPSTQSHYAKLNGKVDNLVAEMNALKLQVQMLTTTVESLIGNKIVVPNAQQTSDTRKLPATTRDKPHVLRSTRHTQLSSSSDQSVETERNKEYLATLTCDQVNQMITNMGLSKSEFVTQSVDGRQLLEMDEKTLQETFQTKSVYHKKRLMRVVSGALHPGTYISTDS